MSSKDLEQSLAEDASEVGLRLCELDRLCHPIWVYDFTSTRVLWSNQCALHFWHASSNSEMLDRNMGSDMSLSVAKRLDQYKTDFHEDESIQFREFWTMHPNGEPTNVNVRFSSYRLNSGRMCMFCEGTVNEALGAETLRTAEALLHTSVKISLYTASGTPLYRNPAARGIVHGRETNLYEHFTSSELKHQLNDPSMDEVKAITSVDTVNGVVWHDITARRCLDAVSGKDAWLISEVDVSRLKATEEHAQFLAEHDTLTKLPNRNHVSIYFQAKIDKVIASGKSGGLVFIDLDNFKHVNDSLGHDAGDQLLIEVSNRLNKLAGSRYSVARLGGDEFLLLIHELESQSQLEPMLQEVIDGVSAPITLRGCEVQSTPSIGVALFPSNGTHITELMRHADLAMYHAKETGKNSFAFFSKDLSDEVESKIGLVSELRAALKKDEFVAYFQPRVCVKDNIIVGAEALARWNHPTKGFVPPDTFIPLCEEAGLIGVLGKIIFTQAVIAQRSWAQQGCDLSISVNLSPLQFNEESLIDDLLNIVAQHDGNPKRIELEITESVLLGHDQSTVEKLHKLVECGFEIAIDDFGTGYSNLAYLHRYPISCLKIDRSFISSMDSAKPIIELIVSMAKLFNLYVVAEGVETTEQLEMLQAYNCEEYQGYLFEKPIDLDSFTAMVIQQEKKAA